MRIDKTLQQLWEQGALLAAHRFLDDWIRLAEVSGIRVLKTFTRTLARCRTGILARHDHPISTGPLEGTNNKTKTLKRHAYGFRDQEYFKLQIMAPHYSRFELIG